MMLYLINTILKYSLKLEVKMKKLVSVIIPAYNAENTIISAIKSVEKLGCNKSFSIIITNDGSTDSTYETINNYKKQTDLEISLLTQDNKGEGPARNSSLSYAESEYVIFLDSDDIFESFDFNKIKDILMENKYDMVIGGYNRVNLGKVQEYKLSERIVDGNNLIDGVCGRVIPAGIGNTFYRTSIIRENSFEFGLYKYGADMEFVRRYVTKCESAYISNEIIFKYNFNPMSVMNQEYSLNRIDAIKSVLDTKSYYDAENIHTPKSLDVFLVCEVRGMAQAYFASCEYETFDYETLFNVSLKYLPSKIETIKFVRKDRTLWLLMNLFFYHFPMTYLKCYKTFLKRYKS